jgi:hypothetical protein
MTDVPKHYDFASSPLEYITKNKLDFMQGNVVKYVSRFRQKGGKDDLIKAADYIRHLLESEYSLTFDLEVRSIHREIVVTQNGPTGGAILGMVPSFHAFGPSYPAGNPAYA